MRVLYISYDGMTDPLGQAQVLPYLLGLRASGHEIELLSFEKPERAGQAPSVRRRLEEAGIRWRPLRYHRRARSLATAFDLAQGAIALERVQRDFRPHVVHCRSYIAGALGLLGKRRHGWRLLFDMRGFWIDERLEGGALRPGALCRGLRRLERALVREADAIVSLSQAGLAELRRWPYVDATIARRLHQVPTCTDTGRFSAAFAARLARPAEASPVLLYLGSFGLRHPPELTLAFLRAAGRALPTARFELLVADGQAAIASGLAATGIDPARIRLDAVPPAEVPSRLAAADLAFFFVRQTYSAVASAPTKLAELLAAGVPVVCGPGVGDVDAILAAHDVGRTVDPTDAPAVAAALADVQALLARDRRGLAERCRRVAVELFDLSVGVARYDAIYRSLDCGMIAGRNVPK